MPRLNYERNFLRKRAGQSLIETCLAVGIMFFIFFAILQISLLFSAKEVLSHAAIRAARARTVGFNHWMVTKVSRIATIPNAGKMLVPDYENVNTYLRSLATAPPGEAWDAALIANPRSAQYDIERARIPEYLYAANRPRASFILDYENWDSIHRDISGTDFLPDGSYAPEITVKVTQNYHLWTPMHRAFYNSDYVNIPAEADIENHYALYLDDMDW